VKSMSRLTLDLSSSFFGLHNYTHLKIYVLVTLAFVHITLFRIVHSELLKTYTVVSAKFPRCMWLLSNIN